MGRYSGDHYEDPHGLRQRIMGGEPEPELSATRLMEDATNLLVEGVDPERTPRTSECPECGHPERIVEEEGPDIGGFVEAVEYLKDNYYKLTESEFREVVAEAAIRSLDETVDEEQTAEAHITLGEFEDATGGGPLYE